MKKYTYFILLFLSLVITGNVLATHNRAGDIRYEHLEGFSYRITVRICVDASSDVDREYIPILWGDGSSQDSIQRTAGPLIIPDSPNTRENYYITTHQFSGPGSYIMLVEDPNRNSNINNIDNSVEAVFSIQSLLVIPVDPSLGLGNNSVVMFNPPKGDACNHNLYLYNPLALDPDGDSLGYELVTPTGAGGDPINNYSYPDEWSPGGDPLLNGPMTLDPQTGLVTWDTPAYSGEYNIAIKISEYRQGYLIGYTIRDMQITVMGLCDNQPPVIDPILDTCVVAGAQIVKQITATDPNNSNIQIEAFGQSFGLDASPSTFNESTGLFVWNTECSHVSIDPYEVLIQASDNSPQVELFDFASFYITVIAPAVENVQVTTSSNDASITWDPSICDQVNAYKIYRRIGSNNFTVGYCETGMPEDVGYSLIGTTEGWSSTFYLDEDIPFGNEVCYRIVACFPDESESIVSDESCVRIDLEIPVITKVSVGITDLLLGTDTIQWIPPLEINTTDFPPPYHYILYVGTDGNFPSNEIFTTPPSAILDEGILQYIHQNIDTQGDQHNYRVAFYSNGEYIDSSYPSNSIFLSLTPDDNQIDLQWNEQVGWINNSYDIYRSINGSNFSLINTTTDTQYLDNGLDNNIEHCYFVVSSGTFDDPLIPSTIINYSQKSCDQPWDQTPPCAPTLDYSGSCEEENILLIWNNPNNSCADDVTQYNLYYSPVTNGDFSLVQTINSPETTEFYVPTEQNVGCWLITALDSLVENPAGEIFQNESTFSDTLCIEGCPTYELPNVITSNGDHINDLFVPFPYKSVQDVDMRIYDRWGLEVFQTTDPDIKWNGTNQATGKALTDGVYYYVVVVNEITLEGIVPRKLNGTIQLLDNSNKNEE